MSLGGHPTPFAGRSPGRRPTTQMKTISSAVLTYSAAGQEATRNPAHRVPPRVEKPQLDVMESNAPYRATAHTRAPSRGRYHPRRSSQPPSAQPSTLVLRSSFPAFLSLTSPQAHPSELLSFLLKVAPERTFCTEFQHTARAREGRGGWGGDAVCGGGDAVKDVAVNDARDFPVTRQHFHAGLCVAAHVLPIGTGGDSRDGRSGVRVLE